jgi:polyhydroxybutyrate depolymerase
MAKPMAVDRRAPAIHPSSKGRAALAAVLGCVLAWCGVLGVGPSSAIPVGNTRGELAFGGLQRTYLVHSPAGTDSPAGLVINLHGSGASGQTQAAITNYDPVADALGFVVAYPDGIDQSWADGRGASPADRRGIDDVGFLVALVDRLVRDYGINQGRVFATGISAGAFMANRLACDRADVVAAIAPVAGTLGAGVPCNPSRAVSVLESHGTADPVVPYDGGTMLGLGGASDVLAAPAMASRWRDVDRCAGAPIEDVLPATGDGTAVHRFTAVGCAGGADVVLLRIDGGGHTWPSGSFALPTGSVGATTDVFNASLGSAQFFAAHGR